jgi:CTP synthase (UTP-ammonia lyase)
LFQGTALRVSAEDPDGEARAVELDGHPFFVATMFQPERAGLEGRAHPIVAGFVTAAREARAAAARGGR